MLLLALIGCFRNCPDVSEETLAELPGRLSESDPDLDVLAYEPNFALWSDGAEKRRWIRLPPDSVIDATDPDRWRFPEGTQLWKEFSVDGEPVETRMIEKIGPADADWAAVAYLWDGDDALSVPDGMIDANGTDHDVPTAEECLACHGGRESFALGFSAVQLNGPILDTLVADGRISPPPGPIGEPAADADALGYLYANCSHCHNPDRRDRLDDGCYTPDVDIDFSLPASVIDDVHDAPAVDTAGNRLDEIVHRMSIRNPKSVFPTSMPPLGTEQTDEQGIAIMTAWIESLGAR